MLDYRLEPVERIVPAVDDLVGRNSDAIDAQQ